MQLSGNLVTLYLFQAAAGRLYPIPLGTLSPMRGRLSDGAAAGRTFYPFGQILRRAASAVTESRRSLYPSGGRYLLGRAGERLSRGRYGAALRLPYPLGTTPTMKGRLADRVEIKAAIQQYKPQ